MKEKLLISACMLGLPCRYDGKGKTLELPRELFDKFELIPFCPEVFGGLPTPRMPSERVGERVMMADGTDVTEYFLRGAECALSLCRTLDCRLALLKERSPSCGSGRIYDGSFSGTFTDGDGTTAELLRSRGIAVFGESEIEKLLSEG